MSDMIGYILRKNLRVGGARQQVEGDLFVDEELFKIFYLETSLVTYEYYQCLHNKKPKFLEVRIEENKDGTQNITESIVKNAP